MFIIIYKYTFVNNFLKNIQVDFRQLAHLNKRCLHTALRMFLPEVQHIVYCRAKLRHLHRNW